MLSEILWPAAAQCINRFLHFQRVAHGVAERLVHIRDERHTLAPHVAPDSDHGLGQFARILEALALANAQGDVPLAGLLNHEGRRFGRRTTIIVITPSTDDSWVGSLQLLASRGVKIAAVVLEPRTFGGEGNALFVFGALAAAEIQTYLIKRSDDMAAALGSGADARGAGVR